MTSKKPVKKFSLGDIQSLSEMICPVCGDKSLASSDGVSVSCLSCDRSWTAQAFERLVAEG